MTTPTPLGTEYFSTYVDVELEVKPWLQMQGLRATSTERDFALQIITDAICTEVQRFTGRMIGPQTFGPADGIGKFDGSGGLFSGYIMLPRTPVIEIVSVIEYQGDTPVTLVEVDPSTGNTGGDGYQIEYRTGRLTRVLGGVWNRPFYPGSNNVWVTWVAGFNPIPPDIRWATLEWIAHVYRNTQQSVRSSSRGGGDVEESAMAGLWVGMPNRIANVLESYLRIGIR
jgi:hypothetical protein